MHESKKTSVLNMNYTFLTIYHLKFRGDNSICENWKPMSLILLVSLSAHKFYWLMRDNSICEMWTVDVYVTDFARFSFSSQVLLADA